MVTGFDFAGKQINQEQDTEAERAVLPPFLGYDPGKVIADVLWATVKI